MKNLKSAFLLLIGLFIISACTVEKRVYNKGFHVQWNKRLKSPDAVHHERDVQLQSEGDKFVEDRSSVRANSADWIYEASRSASHMFQDETLNSSEEVHALREVDGSDVHSNYTAEEQFGKKKTRTKEISVFVKEQRNTTNKSASEPTVGTSQQVALILVILVGVLGIHRFYLGYYGIGILMILTLGCCGILALIDLIRIAIGDLKPKYGEYTETLWE